MEESTSKEKILKKIRNALITKTEAPYPETSLDQKVFQDVEDLDITFASEFTKIHGKFVYCENKSELAANLRLVLDDHKKDHIYCFDDNLVQELNELKIIVNSSPENFFEAEVGIITCEYLIARLGSIMISSKQTPGRRINVYPETLIVIADTKQLVPELQDALKNIRIKYKDDLPSMVSLVTGPSKTADIEKTIVLGAHGPKNLFLFLLEEPLT
jgi:L-lactate dehydrogenase complex protein LldG